MRYLALLLLVACAKPALPPDPLLVALEANTAALRELADATEFNGERLMSIENHLKDTAILVPNVGTRPKKIPTVAEVIEKGKR